MTTVFLLACSSPDVDDEDSGRLDSGTQLDAGRRQDAGRRDAPPGDAGPLPNLSPCLEDGDCESDHCVDVLGTDRRECSSAETCLADADGTSVIILADETVCDSPRSRTCMADGTFGEASCDRGCGAECDSVDWMRTVTTCEEERVSPNYSRQEYGCAIADCLEIEEGEAMEFTCPSGEVCFIPSGGFDFCQDPSEPPCGDGTCEEDEDCPIDCD